MAHRSPIRRVVDPLSPDPRSIGEAVRFLLEGKLVAYPTDTLYGLGADPRCAGAVEHLFRAKRRAPTEGIPLIAADVLQIEACLGRLSRLGRRLADVFWPGPLTMVIAAGSGLNPRVRGEQASVAVRVPDYAIARELAAELGHPLTATSANVSGQAAATTADEAVKALDSELAMVLDGGPTGAVHSTIIDVRNATPVLLRAGVVPWDRVLQSLA